MNQTDYNEFVNKKSENVIQLLALVLAKLGWQHVDVGQLSLTSELLEEEQATSPRCYTAIVTCIPIGDTTELLLTVDGAGKEGTRLHASNIMTNLSRIS